MRRFARRRLAGWGADGGRYLSFALLAFLARNANRVVSRDEIFASVWNGVAVTDDALTQTVRALRNALEDDAQELIRTVTKRGYTMICTEIEPEPNLRAD